MKKTTFGKALVGIAAGLFVGLFLIDCVSDLPPISSAAGNSGHGGQGSVAGNNGTAGNNDTSSGGIPFTIDTSHIGGNPVVDAGNADVATGPEPWPPTGFTNETAVAVGAYALGPQITSTDDAGAAGASGGPTRPATACTALYGVVRDFKMGNQTGGHPDFETNRGSWPPPWAQTTSRSTRRLDDNRRSPPQVRTTSTNGTTMSRGST